MKMLKLLGMLWFIIGRYKLLYCSSLTLQYFFYVVLVIVDSIMSSTNFGKQLMTLKLARLQHMQMHFVDFYDCWDGKRYILNVTCVTLFYFKVVLVCFRVHFCSMVH